MTVNELIARFNELGLTGDEKVRVEASGGMRSGKDVESVSVGFDWNAGAVILHPAVALQMMHVKRKRKPATE